MVFAKEDREGEGSFGGERDWISLSWLLRHLLERGGWGGKVFHKLTRYNVPQFPSLPPPCMPLRPLDPSSQSPHPDQTQQLLQPPIIWWGVCGVLSVIRSSF